MLCNFYEDGNVSGVTGLNYEVSIQMSDGTYWTVVTNLWFSY